MLRTNVDRLVKISVVGEVASPVYGRGVYNISAEGVPMVLPGVGGITYNVRVGDPACGWEADHVEPGFSGYSGAYKLCYFWAWSRGYNAFHFVFWKYHFEN